MLRLDGLAYDASHRVTKRIDARGQATEYTYDALGRVTAVLAPDGTVTQTRFRSEPPRVFRRLG